MAKLALVFVLTLSALTMMPGCVSQSTDTVGLELSASNVKAWHNGNTLHILMHIENPLDRSICFNSSEMNFGGGYPEVRSLSPSSNREDLVPRVQGNYLIVSSSGRYNLSVQGIAILNEYKFQLPGFACGLYGHHREPGIVLLENGRDDEIIRLNIGVFVQDQ